MFLFYLNNFFASGIGDHVVCTALPENIYKATGKKCFISNDTIWPFKYNPYVTNDKACLSQEMIDLGSLPYNVDNKTFELYARIFPNKIATSQTEIMCFLHGIHDVSLNHPRLYIYENEDVNPSKIVVHTTGSNRCNKGEPPIKISTGEDSIRVMSDDVIKKIITNYKDYEIIQLGAETDKPLGGHSIDLRGKLNLWQVAKEIATSSKFIGINSGLMHIANCYPNVEKRIVLQEFSEDGLLRNRPGFVYNHAFHWLDPSLLYFNKYDRDLGFSRTYLKI